MPSVLLIVDDRFLPITKTVRVIGDACCHNGIPAQVRRISDALELGRLLKESKDPMAIRPAAK